MANKYTYLMSAVGLTLHAWSQVESAMSQLFWHVSGTDDMHKAEAIFDTIVSFETRIAVLDAVTACEDQLSDEEKLIWASLSSRLRKFYRKRHEVAHFGISSPEDMIYGTRITPFFTWGKARAKTNKYLNHDQIMARANAFASASRAVGWFTSIMLQRRLPSEDGEPPPQEPELILHIRELLAQRREGQPPQPEPELE
jgi:hypothetical protein